MDNYNKFIIDKLNNKNEQLNNFDSISKKKIKKGNKNESNNNLEFSNLANINVKEKKVPSNLYIEYYSN